jgi:RNA-binding protein 26
VLADYVLALLRHDGDESTVRQLCENEIPDFLKEDSIIFVRDVFDAIHYKSYLPGYIPPRKTSVPFAPPTGPSAPSYGSLGESGPPLGAPLGPQNGSRKRSYNDRGDGDVQFQGGDLNGRSYKHLRRGGPGMGRGTYDKSSPAGRGGRPSAMNPQHMAQYPNMPGSNRPGMTGPEAKMFPGAIPDPYSDVPMGEDNPMSALFAMQALGIPVPGFLESLGMPHQGKKSTRPRCVDYEQKGFCAKGHSCKFEHGENSIWVPPVKAPDEYDPTNSGLMGGPGNARGGFNRFRGGDRGRGRGGAHNGGSFGNSTRRGNRSEFSSDRPNYDKSNTAIVVENIPEEKFSEEQVRAFFTEFGNVMEVDMRPYKRLAIVKFDDWNSAKTAYNSPKVIFDNRFVKVYWYVSQEALPKPPAGSANFSTEGSLSTTPAPLKPTEETPIDIEEFNRKQEEVQKAHEEKMKKTQEMEAAKKDLEKRQEELLRRQAEEKRKLMEKIAAKKGASATSLTKQEDGSLTTGESKAATQTELLKAQLAALEAEAQSLGIDPSQVDDMSWASRGRGRGRGGYRGRGAYVPRGFRGGYRGRGGAPFVPGGRSFNLDNRPKKIGITGVDFSNPEKDESLRHYLLVSDFLHIAATLLT